MATISENLQIIKDSTDAIKQAIIDKGGTITGNISTWANAINGISSSELEEYILTGTITNNLNTCTINGKLNKIPSNGSSWLLVLCYSGALYLTLNYLSDVDDTYSLTLNYEYSVEVEPGLCILNWQENKLTIIPVKFQEEIGTNPA